MNNPLTPVQKLRRERKQSKDLAAALSALLEDTQHVDHNCGDDDCPVMLARHALVSYEDHKRNRK